MLTTRRNNRIILLFGFEIYFDKYTQSTYIFPVNKDFLEMVTRESEGSFYFYRTCAFPAKFSLYSRHDWVCIQLFVK